NSPGRHVFECTIDKLPLVPGNYHLTLGVASRGRYFDAMERVAHIEVRGADVFDTGDIPRQQRGAGYFLVPARWNTSR
ncbi:MAG: hypothetical protein OEV00_14860, partial [Acidobacteriota bacterium]|nr:hypothetical protein [Acidobacteriota bacterium]